MTTREQIAEILDRDPDRLIGHPDDRGRVIDLWEATGMTPDEVERWVEAGAFEPEAAVEMRDAGVTPEQAATRTDAGHSDYEDTVAAKVSNGDLSIGQALAVLGYASVTTVYRRTSTNEPYGHKIVAGPDFEYVCTVFFENGRYLVDFDADDEPRQTCGSAEQVRHCIQERTGHRLADYATDALAVLQGD